jgi:hypothetical protein
LVGCCGLKAKLEAFDRGVDDILTVPFSPEEFVARTLVIMRRTYREATVFAPVLRIGDLQIAVTCVALTCVVRFSRNAARTPASERRAPAAPAHRRAADLPALSSAEAAARSSE